MAIEFPQGEIDFSPDQVTILWEDGLSQKLSAAFLRSHCPCATCRNAAFPLEEGMFPGIEVVDLDMVGAYAIQFEYSDGHKTGAYPYPTLRGFADAA